MNLELRETIKNAKVTALKIDGYDQAVIKEKDKYGFIRNYEGCCPEWLGTIIGIVKVYWENGIRKVRYETMK